MARMVPLKTQFFGFLQAARLPHGGLTYMASKHPSAALEQVMYRRLESCLLAKQIQEGPQCAGVCAVLAKRVLSVPGELSS